MSRSNPTPTNPASKLFRWAGSTGKMQWYDRETKTRIDAPLPFKFLVLDELHTIGGFSERDKSGIWANEVRTMKEQLNVRTGSGQLGFGTYEFIKDTLKANGGKYARSVYIAFEDGSDDPQWLIGNIKLTGAALGAWFDLKRTHNVEEGAVMLTGSTKDKNGSVEYHVPTFEITSIDSETDQLAGRLDKALQAYLDLTLAARAANPVAEPIDESEAHDEPAEDEDDQKPIDLSEIPF